MNTRPPSNDPADVAAWEEEKARLREEREFRDKMLEHAGDTKARLQNLADAMDAHAEEDRKRFDALESKTGTVSQSIDGAHNKIHMLWGIGVGVTAVLGLALWLMERAP